jgi:phage terminase large subunit-like protein
VQHTVRYWDKAGTESEDAAYTAGVRMHAMTDGMFIVSHVVRGQWAALEREEIFPSFLALPLPDDSD